MVFGKLIKPLMVSCVALWAWTSSANAVLLSDVEPVLGGSFITDGSVTVSSNSDAITFVGSTGAAGGGSINPPIFPLLTTGSLLLTGPTITSGSFVSNLGTGSLFLSGSFMDAVFEVDVLRVLFSVTGGSAAADFGDWVVVSLASLPPLQPDGIGTAPAVLSIDSAQLVQLSAPAVLGLFLPGIGLLLLLNSRYVRARRSGSQIC